MANNFFGKLRDLVSNTWTEADYQAAEATEAPSNDGKKLSGVEKYLAKQAAAQKSAEAVPEEKALTGVERYLAKLSGNAQAVEESSAPLTGVAKYLARKDGTLKKAEAPAAKPAPEPTAPLSKVDKYLAAQKNKAAAPSIQPEEAAAPAPAKPAAKKKNDAVKTKVEEIIDLSASATQCQAGTTKGTQCRNTLRLNQLQRTIDGKTYMFAACNQHNNDGFKPFQQI